MVQFVQLSHPTFVVVAAVAVELGGVVRSDHVSMRERQRRKTRWMEERGKVMESA